MSSSRQRRDGDRRPSDRGDRRDRDDRRDAQPEDDQQRRPGDIDLQESDSLTALKVILGKVAGLLTSLKLTQDECISLVEQLYGTVLDMDLKLAGETDDKRKASIQAHIQNTQITRSGGKLVLDFPKMDASAEAAGGSETRAKAPAEKQEKPSTEEKVDAPAQKPASASQKPQSAPEPAAESTPEQAPEPATEQVPEPDPEPAAETPAEQEQADA